MRLCRVLGNVVATAHHPSNDGHKLMVVEPIEGDARAAATGPSFLAIDTVQAGPGDRVLVLTEGTGVRQILGFQKTDDVPIRSLIVGVVDAVDTTGA